MQTADPMVTLSYLSYFNFIGIFSTVMSNKEQGDNRDDCLWGLCNRDESRPAASAITDSVTVAVVAVGYGTRVAAGAIGYGTTTAAAYFMDGTKTVAGAVRDGTVSAAGLLRDGTAAATSAMRDQPTAAVVGTAVAVGTTTMVAAPLVLAMQASPVEGLLQAVLQPPGRPAWAM